MGLARGRTLLRAVAERPQGGEPPCHYPLLSFFRIGVLGPAAISAGRDRAAHEIMDRRCEQRGIQRRSKGGGFAEPLRGAVRRAQGDAGACCYRRRKKKKNR